MSFRIRIEGVEVECDTAGEVRELLGMRPPLPALPNPTPRNVDSGVRGIIGKGGTARSCSKCGEPGHRSDSKECPKNQKPSASAAVGDKDAPSRRIPTTEVMRDLRLAPKRFLELIKAAGVKPFTVNGVPHLRGEDVDRIRRAVAA